MKTRQHLNVYITSILQNITFFFLNTTAGTAKNIEVNAYTGI